MTFNNHDRNARKFLRARLLGRRAELARLGALVQGDRLIKEGRRMKARAVEQDLRLLLAVFNWAVTVRDSDNFSHFKAIPHDLRGNRDSQTPGPEAEKWHQEWHHG